MNPTVPEDVIKATFEADEVAAAAEYGALFRRDVDCFIPKEVVEAAVAQGCFELPPLSNIRYVAFVDPSGGSQDSMTLAIAHHEHRYGKADFGVAILDAVREVKPPLSPEAVVIEFTDLLKRYGIYEVTGDHYGCEFVREPFRKHGIEYRVSEKPKADIYRELLPLVNSGRIELLANTRLVAQLCFLERRTARGGRDSSDHPPNGRDDVANAAAGALLLAASSVANDIGLAPPIVIPRWKLCRHILADPAVRSGGRPRPSRRPFVAGTECARRPPQSSTVIA
jgi:hypothetical protein